MPKTEKEIAHFFIFSGVSLVDQQYFDKDQVAIGCGPAADLVLPGKGVADLQALIYFRGDEIIISDRTASRGVIVNGKAEQTALLHPFDLVDIGPYTLKVKMERGAEVVKLAREQKEKAAAKKAAQTRQSQDASPAGSASTPAGPYAAAMEPNRKKTTHEPEASPHKSPAPTADIQEEFDTFIQAFSRTEPKRYNLIFASQFRPGIDRDRAKRQLAGLFRCDLHQIERLFAQSHVVIKENVDHETGMRMKRAFDATGAISTLEPIGHSMAEKDVEAKSVTAKPAQGAHLSKEKTPPMAKEPDVATLDFGPEDEDEEDDGIIDLLAIADEIQGARAGTEQPPQTKLPIAAAQNRSESGQEAKRHPAPEIDIETAKVTLLEDIASHGDLSTVSDIVKIDGGDNGFQEEPRDDIYHLEEQSAQSLEEKAGPVEVIKTSSEKLAAAAAGCDYKSGYEYEYDDEEDEEDDDIEASFLLRDKFIQYQPSQANSPIAAQQGDRLLEVLKYRGDTVIDARYLNPKQKYFITGAKGRFCLAEYKRSQKCFFYFDSHLKGVIKSGGAGTVGTDQLKKRDKPWRRRKGIYREFVPDSGDVLLDDGSHRYLLRRVFKSPEVAIKEAPKEETRNYKHMMTSVLFHVFFITFLGLFPSFNVERHKIDETHFVQLDTSQLEDLEKIANKIKKVPPKPKPKVEPPKPEPKPVTKPSVKKPKPKKKKKPKKRVQVASTKKRKPAKSGAVASRHPKAGGGHGKGNTINRDVNQAGILSMIGDSVSLQPQAAIAAVTNLDAVSSPNVGAGNYKVGGIAGKLGTDKISAPTSGIIATKGSTQVLRSAGAGGKGTVAALEKGSTGQKKVGGLVTANLTKSVRIQGGMSREQVKRVIDQHLDEINYCYEVALISNPAIMGQMTFEWKILMSGRVGEIRIKSSSINSHEIHTCIKAAIKSWQFPSPKGSEVIVSYPFVFDVVGF